MSSLPIRLACGAGIASLLLTGFVLIRPLDAADPPSHVLHKADAGCPADVLSAKPGTPKATAERPSDRKASEDSIVEQRPTPGATDATTVVLEKQPGLLKQAFDTPAPPDAPTLDAGIDIHPEGVKQDDLMTLQPQSGEKKVDAGGPSTTVAQSPRLFHWSSGHSGSGTGSQPRTVLMTTPPRQESVTPQRRPNALSEKSTNLALLGPLEVEMDRTDSASAVQAVQAEADANTGPAQTAEPVPTDAASAAGDIADNGQQLQEPGVLMDGGYPAYCPDHGWSIPWEVFAQGEYIGPARLPHVMEYRLRVDDQLEFVYRLSGAKSNTAYRINIGDTLRVESLTAENLNREVLVQPDGSISLRQLGQVPASGRTIDELRQELDKLYAEYVQNPTISVTPVTINTTLEELRATVDSRFGSGGQSRLVTVTPEGTVQLPAIGSVPAHGLTLEEVGYEVELRYANLVDGLQVTPILAQRAPRYVYVVGEVTAPGRYTLEAPTSLMQAIALAGGWNVGGNLRQVVVFRRDENWQLMACKINIRGALYGKDLCPDGEIWLRDSDIVVVPKCPVLVADDFIELVFTRGIYGVFPFGSNLSFVRNLSTVGGIVPVPVVP